MSAPTRARPEAGSTIELTRDEREMLNCLLTVGIQYPEMFGGESAELRKYFKRTFTRIQEKLPLRPLPNQRSGQPATTPARQ